MEKIEQEPADRRKTLLRNIKGQKTDSPQIRKRLGSCPYHTGEGLCGLQQEGRTDLMPRVCREYPRRTISYEAFAEIALELACPEVARLFLEEKEPLSMLPWQKEEREILWKIGNEDLPFLEFLQELRQTMVDEAQTQERFDVALLYRQYRCFDAMHEHLMRDKRAEANAVLDAYRNRCQESRRVGEQEDLDAGAPRQMLFFPMDLVDKVIAHQLDLPNLAVNNAYLKKCIRLYYRLCNGKTAEEAGAFLKRSGRKWKRKCRELMTNTASISYTISMKCSYVSMRIIICSRPFSWAICIWNFIWSWMRSPGWIVRSIK